jgi:O-antigen ligase
VAPEGDPAVVKRLGAAVPAGYLALLCAATVLAPGQGHTAAVSWLALILLAALGAWGVYRGGSDWDRLITAGIAFVPLAVVLARSITAPNPWIAIFGMAGQHSSVTAWWVMWSCFAILMLAGRRSDLRPLFAVVAATGAFFGLMVLLERLDVVDLATGRFSPEPAAFFDSSISLAQYLVLALGCAVALGMSRSWSRWLGWGSALLVLAGIAGSSARASWIGVLVGAAGFVMLAGGSQPWRKLRPIAVAVVGGAGLAYVMSFLAAAGLLGEQVYGIADSVLTGRLHVWEVAMEDLAAAPLLGAGPGHFGAVADWNVAADGLLQPQFTSVPHSMLLWWATAAGVAGIVAFGAAAWFVGRGLVGSIRQKGAGLPAAAAGAGLIAWTTTVLFSWTNPLAMAAAGLLAGGLLAVWRRPGADVARRADEDRAVLAGRALLLGVAVVSAVLALLFWPEASHEVRTARAETLDGDLLADHLETTRDPSYAHVGIARLVALAVDDRALAPDAVAEARAVAAEWDDDADWNISLAYNRMEAEWVGFAVAGTASWQDVLAEVEKAESIDPATGAFSFWAAVNAAASGQLDEALRLAERSYEIEATDAAEALIESLR